MPTARIHASNHQVTFAVLTGGVAAYALLQSLVVPVLPTIQRSLHTSQTTVTWVLTAYLLSASVFTPIMGRIGDMVGKKKMFVITLAVLAAGSLMAAVATSIGVMIVARVIQGIGGGVLPLAFGIVRDEFPKERVSSAVGSLAALTSVGAGLGIVLAGPIVDSLDYHWLFWLPMILITVSAVAAYFFVPESPNRTPGRISVLPAVLLSAWLVALLVAVSEAPIWGWGSVRVVGLLVLSVVLAVAWVNSEQRAVTPLIDMKMMRIPAVWTSNVVALLVGVGMYATFAFVPEFVQTPSSAGYGFGASITQSGLILLPSSIATFIVGLFCGRMAAAIGAKMVIILGSLAATGATVILAFAHTHEWELYLANVFLGLGFGMVYAAMSSLIVDSVPAAQTGVASGMNANIRTIGGAIGAALMASIIAIGHAPNGLPRDSGYTHGFEMLIAALGLCTVAAMAIPTTRRRRGSRAARVELEHAELALVAGGTVFGDSPE
jgi:EmrB/QacA subfamily drug resistance transporter